jgi:type IV secretion system protein VirD4
VDDRRCGAGTSGRTDQRIRASLAASDFKFEDLKTSKMTVYLVLPADRLQTFGRWLRLLVQQGITVNARNVEVKPDKPILFLLDEMASLGRLTMVEQAFGLMAGFGMQLWGIVQDLSQLEGIYGKGWETFIGNSGVLQYFGSRDHKTAEYFSKLCGVSTVEKSSFGRSVARFRLVVVFGKRGPHKGGERKHHDFRERDGRRGAALPGLP